MRIITEAELREAWKQTPFTAYTLPPGVKLTPAARQFLSDRRIPVTQAAGETKQPTACGAEKGEAFTHLNGHELVPKQHPRIRFRGLADSFYGFMVELELLAAESALPALQGELKILRKFAGQLIVAEASGKTLPFIDFYGWSPEEIRDRSHHPQKYYGIGHFRVHPADGPVMARLNRMRTQVRELEVSAAECFGSEAAQGGRQDLILALNRFSSLAYILMCRLKSGGYGRG